LLFASTARIRAFALAGPQWAPGAKVVMHLGLESTYSRLQDGFANWNASAADAVSIWDGYLDVVSFSSVSAPTVPQSSGDGVNSVFFSNTVFGDSFGENTLAVTVRLQHEYEATYREADVVVNSEDRFDSYRTAPSCSRDSCLRHPAGPSSRVWSRPRVGPCD
ncbi:MAG TPA: hypothetical protein VGI85_15680, partial [Chthoniobacterales bacterium]